MTKRKFGIDWGKKTTWIIVGALLLLFAILAVEEVQAENRTLFEVGHPLTYVGGQKQDDGLALFFTERFQEKYEVGLIFLSEHDCGGCSRGDLRANMGIQVKRVVRWRFFEMGLGAAGWANESSAWDQRFTFALHARVWPKEKIFVTLDHHFSTGGSSARNGGLDVGLTFGYAF